MRCELTTASDLWKAHIKAKSPMSPRPPPPVLCLRAEIISNPPQSLQPSKAELSAVHSRGDFEQRSHLKAICLRRGPTCHFNRRLSLDGAGADGDRHPSCASCRLPLRDVKSRRPDASALFAYSCRRKVKNIPFSFWGSGDRSVHQSPYHRRPNLNLTRLTKGVLYV